MARGVAVRHLYMTACPSRIPCATLCSREQHGMVDAAVFSCRYSA